MLYDRLMAGSNEIKASLTLFCKQMIINILTTGGQIMKHGESISNYSTETMKLGVMGARMV